MDQARSDRRDRHQQVRCRGDRALAAGRHRRRCGGHTADRDAQLEQLLAERGITPLGMPGWHRIDAAEIELGAQPRPASARPWRTAASCWRPPPTIRTGSCDHPNSARTSQNVVFLRRRTGLAFASDESVTRGGLRRRRTWHELIREVSTLEARRVDEVGAGLVARDFELDSALHSLRFSGGVVIIGEAGVGKTALAAAVAERLRTPPVGWVVATAASRTIPLGALSNLLPADLATIHPALIAQHVDTRLRELGRADHRATAAPVVVLDDAQLLDAQSAAVLLSLVAAKSLRLLVTMRSGSSPSDAITALWKEQLVDRLDLSPLNHRATRQLLESLLDGPVASGTVEMLWSSSRGNPFYLTELARFGAGHGQLEPKSGVWWWLGGTEMPPRLGELLQRRIDAVSAAGREAIELLALGEPLPYETLSAVVSEDAILELDERKIVTSDERDGGCCCSGSPIRCCTPWPRRQLSPTRRRALAGRLRDAPADHVDVVRRAAWEDAAGGTPNVDLLLSAADAVMLNDAASAVRLATRAQPGRRRVPRRDDAGCRPVRAGPAGPGPRRLWTRGRERQSRRGVFAYLSRGVLRWPCGASAPRPARGRCLPEHELLPDSYRNRHRLARGLAVTCSPPAAWRSAAGDRTVLDTIRPPAPGSAP